MATESSSPPVRDHRRVILVSSAAALGGFLFGFDSAVINGAVGAIRDRFDLGPGLLGFVVSIALLGSAVGAWFAGQLADRFGRIHVMVTAAVLFIVSAIGSALPFAAYDLMFWRFVGGMGIGIASVIAPAYIGEIAPADIRGRLGSLQQLAIVLGIFAALLSDYVIAALAGGSASNELWWGLEAWQWMFLVGIIPAAIYGVLSLFIPESPYYLVASGKLAEARAVFERIIGGNAHDKVEGIAASLNTEHRPSVRDLRGKSFGLLPIVWIGIILSVLQQFVGINVIFYYSSVLWQAVGFSEDDSLKISVFTSIVNIVTTIIAILLIDRVGRKPLLLFGSTGMVLTLGTLAVLFGTAPLVQVAATPTCGAPCMQPSLTGAAGTIALVAANFYVFFFGMSWGPAIWVLLGEMFPNSVRAAALAVAAAAQWLANWAVSTSFPTLSSWSLGLAYGIYTFFAAVSIWFVARKVRETRGIELGST